MSTTKIPLQARTLLRVHHPKIIDFYFSFRNVHTFTWTSSRSLETAQLPIAPLAPALLKRYEMREEVPLWWGCVGQKETGDSKRTVRSWLARRTRNAFTESLNKKGWDIHGRLLQDLEKGVMDKRSLYGTAFLSVKATAVKLSYEELVKQTDVAVEEMERIVRERKPKKAVGRKGGQSVPRRSVMNQ